MRSWERSEEARKEYESFAWPITEVKELRRLLDCHHIAPTWLLLGEFTRAQADELEMRRDPPLRKPLKPAAPKPPKTAAPMEKHVSAPRLIMVELPDDPPQRLGGSYDVRAGESVSAACGHVAVHLSHLVTTLRFLFVAASPYYRRPTSGKI